MCSIPERGDAQPMSANPYLKTRIMTASPEELRLLLIEGAIKFARQAADAIGSENWEKMYESLVRAQKIVMELINGLNPKVDPDLCDKMAGLYTYLHGRLVDANMRRDLEPVNEVITRLEFERETWVMAMSKLQQERGADAPADPSPPNPIASIGPDPTPQADESGGTMSVEG